MQSTRDPKALILDTNIIGRDKYTLENIIKMKEQGLEDSSRAISFTTRGVIAELHKWETKVDAITGKQKEDIQVKIEHAKSRIQNPLYQTINTYVLISEDETNSQHDPLVQRILYNAIQQPLDIDIKDAGAKRNGLRLYFKELKEKYAAVLQELNIGINIHEQEINIGLKNAGKKAHRSIRIKSNDDMNEHFLEYEGRVEQLRQELEMIDAENAEYNTAMKVFGYFQIHPEQVLHYPTDREILKFARLTPKAIALDVCQEYFGNRQITERDIPYFIKRVNDRLFAALSQETGGSFSSSLGSLLGYGVKQVECHIGRVVKNKNGIFCDINVDTDANLVSSAIQLRKDHPEYSEVRIATYDADIGIMVALANSFYNSANTIVRTTLDKK